MKSTLDHPVASRSCSRFPFAALAAIVLLVAGLGAEVHAQDERPLVVGTRHAPPFAIHADDGTWSGLTIELWRWIATHDPEHRFVVVSGTFEPQEYGLALPNGSPLREEVNRRLLRHTASDAWRELLQRTLGS